MVGQAINDKLNPFADNQNTRDWRKAADETKERKDDLGKSFNAFLERERTKDSKGIFGKAKEDYEYLKQFQAGEGKQYYPSLNQGAQPVQKATGSWGTTGKLIENFGTGTPAELHGKEGVITEDQLNQIMAYAMKSGGENKLGASIEKLNMLTGQMLAVNKEIADNIRKNVEATKRLGGNLFA